MVNSVHRLALSILLLAKLERNVPVLDHVLDFETAQEQGHKYEVEEEEWPVDCDICRLEARGKGSYRGGTHQFFPEFHLLNLPLEAFIFVLFSLGKDKVTVNVHTVLQVFWVLRRAQKQHNIVQIEEAKQVCYDCIPLLNVHSQEEES